jgi:hypothetical protein
MQQRVSDHRKRFEFGAALRARPDVAQRLGSSATGQRSESQLCEVVPDHLTPGRVFKVAAHWGWSSNEPRSSSLINSRALEAGRPAQAGGEGSGWAGGGGLSVAPGGFEATQR